MSSKSLSSDASNSCNDQSKCSAACCCESSRVALAILQRSDLSISYNDLKEYLLQDAQLTRLILTAASSPLIRRGSKKEISLDDAILSLGRKMLINIAVLLLMKAESLDVQLAVETLLRAETCANVAELQGKDGENYRLVGMLSGISDLLNVSPNQLAKSIRLEATVEAALLERDGHLGQVLDVVTEYTRGGIEAICDRPDVNIGVYQDAYLSAMTYVQDSVTPLLRAST